MDLESGSRAVLMVKLSPNHPLQLLRLTNPGYDLDQAICGIWAQSLLLSYTSLSRSILYPDMEGINLASICSIRVIAFLFPFISMINDIHLSCALFVLVLLAATRY
jgi:hypothetical protein